MLWRSLTRMKRGPTRRIGNLGQLRNNEQSHAYRLYRGAGGDSSDSVPSYPFLCEDACVGSYDENPLRNRWLPNTEWYSYQVNNEPFTESVCNTCGSSCVDDPPNDLACTLCEWTSEYSTDECTPVTSGGDHHNGHWLFYCACPQATLDEIGWITDEGGDTRADSRYIYRGQTQTLQWGTVFHSETDTGITGNQQLEFKFINASTYNSGDNAVENPCSREAAIAGSNCTTALVHANQQCTINITSMGLENATAMFRLLPREVSSE